jgi:hypothetical protein
MLLHWWHNLAGRGSKSARRGRRASARRSTVSPIRKRQPPLTVEQLEPRNAPVVGTFANAAAVAPGTGYDGVVLLTSSLGLGTGSLLFDGRHILTAAHVVVPDEVQRIALAGNPTGGTFTLTFDGQTTVPIAFNAPANGGAGPAASVQNALQALPDIGANNVTVSGIAGGPWTITFQKKLAGKDVSQIVANGASLVGGGVGVTTQTNGGGVVTDLMARFDMPGAPAGITIDIPSNDITTNPNYDPASLKNDIASLTLPVVAPFGAEEYQIYRNYNEIGLPATIVGYGQTGTGATGQVAGTSGTKRMATTTFTDTTFAPTIGRARGLLANFNAGLGPGGGAVGSGDSGGPAFITNNNTPFIAGVNDFIRDANGDGILSDFGDQSGFTRVSYFASWIDQTIAGPYDLVLDMNKQVLGVDGIPNEAVTITASLIGGNLQLQVTAPAAPLTGVYYSAPIVDIRSLTIRGSDDNETVRIVGPLGVSGNTITVDGGAGNNTLLLDYGAGSAATYTVTATTVTRGVGTIHYSAFAAMTLTTGPGADTINVQGTAPGTATTVNTGGGGDQVRVGTAQNRLDGIQVTVNGSNAPNQFNYLTITNEGWNGPETYTLTATTCSIASHGLIVTYHNMQHLELRGGSGNDTVNVLSTDVNAGAVIRTGAGDDTVNVGQNGSMAGIRGSMGIFGGAGNDQLYFNNQNALNRAQYTLDSFRLSIGGMPSIVYFDFEHLELRAGAGNNTISVQGTSPSTQTVVYGGPGGGDDFSVANTKNRLDGIKVTVHGLGGGNSLDIYNTGWTGAETHTITANSYSIASHGQIVGFDGIGQLNLHCGSGPDTINYVNFPGIAVLDGGTGPGSNTVVVGQGGTMNSGLVELRNVQTLQISGGTVDVTRDFSIQNFILSGGILTGPGSLTVLSNPAGVFGAPINATWSGGTMSGTGRTVIAAGARLNITGTGNKTLTDRAIVNDGSAGGFGPGPVGGGNGSLVNDPTGTFGGAGTFTGAISNSGQFGPGGDVKNNVLLDNGDFTQTATGRFDITLKTPTDSTQLKVTGTIKLDGTLNVTTLPGFSGDSFTIIDNLGPNPVMGTFAGLPEGVQLTLGGRLFQITYQGGKGHDVVLQAVRQVKAMTTTNVSSSANPSVYGQSVVFTATVSPVSPGGSALTGTVQFQVDGTNFGTPVLLTAGQATSASLSSLSAGTHLISAIYSGNGSFVTSTGTYTQTVTPAALTITADNQTSVYGAALPALTASYSGFVNGDTAASLTTAPTLTTTATASSAVGSYAITASGAVDPNYTINYVAGTLTINQAGTSTTLSSDNSTTVFGQPITFTATVAALPPGAGIPTGTVAFERLSPDGTSVVTLGTGTLDATGTAAFIMDHFVPSTQTVFAVYQGDGNFAPSPSATITQVINPADTMLALSSSNPVSVAGDPVNFTTSLGPVAPGAFVVPPTGTITFYDFFQGSTTVLATLNLSGPAGQSPALTAAGTHTITAVYSGDSNFNGSSSPPITQIVVPGAATHFSVTTAAVTTAGQSMLVTVTALDSFGNIATGYQGTVHFTSSDGQALLPDDYTFAAGDNGVHSFSTTLTTAGSQMITVTDTLSDTITASATVQVVAAAAASLELVPAQDTVYPGVPFAMTVIALDPFGNVASGYQGTIHFTCSDPLGSVPPDGSFTAADNGVHTFTGFVLVSPGDQSFTATDTVTPTITGTVFFQFMS